MPSLIAVSHPVMRRHRPLRVKNDRFDFGPGVTPVALREVAERPREVLRLGDTRILAAEGTAWKPLRQGKANVTPAEFAAFLALDQDAKNERRCGTWSWARRSPLLYVAEYNRDLTSRLDASARGADDRDTETASNDVRAFLDDRVRLYGDRVLVREESVLGIGEVYAARPWVVMGDQPRDLGTRRYSREAFTAIRPDRLGALWAIHDRKTKGEVPTGEWDRHATLPPELLRDDDAAWIANRSASTFLHYMRQFAKPGFVRDQKVAEAVAIVPVLEAIERRGWTHAIAGAEMLGVLETVREAAGLLATLRMAQVKSRKEPTADNLHRMWTFMERHLDAEILPRANGRLGPEHDVEDLMSLAPA